MEFAFETAEIKGRNEQARGCGDDNRGGRARQRPGAAIGSLPRRPRTSRMPRPEHTGSPVPPQSGNSTMTAPMPIIVRMPGHDGHETTWINQAVPSAVGRMATNMKPHRRLARVAEIQEQERKQGV